MPSLLEKTLIKVHPLYRMALCLRRKHFNAEKYVYTRLIDAGDYVIEGGANRGYFTPFFARWVGPKGRVYAFEPVPPTFKKLQAHCKVYNCDNLNLIPKALWHQNERLSMYVPGTQDGQASLTQHDTGYWNEQKEVQTYEIDALRLDDFIEGVSLKRLDFIKLDLEGAELQALQGAFRVLERFGPILHLELENQWMKDFGSNTESAILFLKELGYTDFLLYQKDGYSVYDFEDVISSGVSLDGNVIAFKKSRKDKCRFFKKIPVSR